MMEIVLIGVEGSRRRDYFCRAAEECQVDVRFIDWKEVADHDLSGNIVKIDPPSYDTSELGRLDGLITAYREELRRLGRMDCFYLNTPEGIEGVLDKYACKKVMQENGIAVTEMFAERVWTPEQLRMVMEEHHVYSVFVKPVYGSGAAGVVAYRYDPAGGREVVYTSSRWEGGKLVNTKRLCRLDEPEAVRRLLTEVLRLGAVVERWYPKASFGGRSYDLRAVWQFGRIEFMVARQSAGPVTNLHLNNLPLDWHELGLAAQTVERIEELCERAMSLFPGLSVAGIDILLDRGSLRPRIIEINGQGDLMYQDIFHENKIYRRQVQEMARRARGLTW